MSTIPLEPLLALVERRAVLAVLRDHPEWTLGHVFGHLERNGSRAHVLRELRLGELCEEPRLDQITLAADGGPPIDRRLRVAISKLTGERFDECVRAVLDEAAGVPVGSAYLRARVGGPRWKLQASLRRLIDAGVVERSGSTNATRYWIAREESRS